MGKEIINQLKDDFKKAAIDKNTIEKNLIQMLRANIQNYIRDNKLTEENIAKEDVYAIMNKELKQQKDSLEAFQKGNREDLANETKQKIEILENYLPTQLTKDEIKDVVLQTMKELNISTITNKDRGKLMKVLMPTVKGKADGKLVNQVVQDLIK